MLSRDAILGFKDERLKTVDVEELGEVCIGSFSVAEMDKIAKLDGSTPASLEAVILGVCDKDGKRMFTANDRAALMTLPSRIISLLGKEVLEHNGLIIGKVEDTPKND